MYDFISKANASQRILVVPDTGKDRTLITVAWKIIARTIREGMMEGAFAGSVVLVKFFPVVSANAELIREDGCE